MKMNFSLVGENLNENMFVRFLSRPARTYNSNSSGLIDRLA